MTDLTRRAALGTVAAAALAPFAATSSAQAAAPLLGKQAASFYRYKVGSFEVTAIADGITVTPRPDNYVVNASKDDVSAVFAANHLPADKATHTYTPVVVNTGSKLVVIDTGFGPGAYAQSKGAIGQFQTNLQAAGIDPAHVDAVIISHFHGDHINGLISADGKPLYPNAEVLVPAAEWKFFMDDGEMSKVAGTPGEANFRNSRRVFDTLGRKVTQFEAGKEPVAGITAIASPGHTPGHTSFVVASGSDKVLVQADITAGAAFLFVKNPDWQLLFDADKALAVQTRRKIYDMAVAEKMPVQAFHAAFPGLVGVEKDGNGYRWIPTMWNTSI